MKLTGKAKEDFQKWLGSDPEHNKEFFVAAGNEYNYDSTLKDLFDDSFSGIEMPFSMQWGVYVDFFDSVNLSLVIDTNHSGYFYEINKLNGTSLWLDLEIETKTRNESRIKAIQKSCEIYNTSQL